MTFISPALISKIYQALGQDKGRDAVRLLREHAFLKQPKHDGELLSAIVRLADDSLHVRDTDRAADHYRLGIALYGTLFQTNHVEALRCASGLMLICPKASADAAQLVEFSQSVLDAMREESKLKVFAG